MATGDSEGDDAVGEGGEGNGGGGDGESEGGDADGGGGDGDGEGDVWGVDGDAGDGHAAGNGAGPQQLAVRVPAVAQDHSCKVSTGASHRHCGGACETGQTKVLQSHDAVGHGKLCAASNICAIRFARSGS